jgi:phytoene dehydrogenase-like protein
VERFAPGFRECILGRAVFGTEAMHYWNENLVGGDINGGSVSGLQFFLRPTWRRYATPMKGVYLCSSSTPPGGAVHGMCGSWAAQRALKAFFANGVDQETELDAAIPPKPGPRGTRSLRARGGKNGRT